jgi:hypothetical protein
MRLLDDRLVMKRKPEGVSCVLLGEILAIGREADSGGMGVEAVASVWGVGVGDAGGGLSGTVGGVVETSLRRGKVTGLEGSV